MKKRKPSANFEANVSALAFPKFSVEPEPFEIPPAPAAMDNLKASEGATNAGLILDELYKYAANGNAVAARNLVGVLTRALMKLEMLGWHRPEVLKGVARQTYHFPGLISRSAEKKKSNDNLLKRIEQGAEYPIDFFSKGKKPEIFAGDSNHLAFRLFGYIESARHPQPLEEMMRLKLPQWVVSARKLRPFSKVTLKQWSALAWEIVMDATNGEPERHPLFEQVKKSATQRRRVSQEKVNLASLARRGIKDRLDVSFALLAKNRTKDS